MEVNIKLCKRVGTYYSEEKKRDIPYTNLYVSINDELIPIDVKYFPNPKLDNRDPAYSARVAQLSLLAELLPDRPSKSTSTATQDAVAAPGPADVPPPSDADAPPAVKK